MRSNWILILFLAPVICSAQDVDKECIDWFHYYKLQANTKNCEIKCTTTITDMGTFMCPGQCDKLCKFENKKLILANFVFYPGLTQSEKELVVKNLREAYLVYEQKGLAEDLTSRNFPNQDLNDESDAFRHFLWSGLLTKELGRQKAKEYLDAHEANPLQSEQERKMDTFNNERGQSTSEYLIKNNSWSIKNLEIKALDELNNKQLQVLNQKLPIPKEPK